MGILDLFVYGIAPMMALPWMYSIKGKEFDSDAFVPVHDGLHHGLVGFLMFLGGFTASKFLKDKAISTVSKIVLGIGLVMFLEDFIHEQVYRRFGQPQDE